MVAIMLTNMFSANNPNTATGGVNQLQNTAKLTSIAAAIVNDIMKTIESDEIKYAPLVTLSQTSHDEMDKLIATTYDLSTVDVEFLKTETEDNIDKMIRSQQSKRSRSKAKTMTLEAYKTMMIGAVSELLLRIASNKPKSATGGGAHTSDIGYSDELLLEYTNDQEKLKKEIRNVQSKKSIMKSKAGFSESDDRWQQLLLAEETLKNLRAGGTTTTVIHDERLDKLEEILSNVSNIESMKGNDAKGLLAKVRDLFNKPEVTEDETKPNEENA